MKQKVNKTLQKLRIVKVLATEVFIMVPTVLKVKISYANVDSPYFPLNPVKEGKSVCGKYNPFNAAPTGLVGISNGKFNMEIPEYATEGKTITGKKRLSVPVSNVQALLNHKGVAVGLYSLGKERIWIYSVSNATGSSTVEEVQLFLNEILKSQSKKPVTVTPVVPKDEKKVSVNNSPSLAFSGVA